MQTIVQKRHSRSLLYVLGLFVFIAAGCTHAEVPVHEQFLNADGDDVMVMAHRADWRNHPENSLSAIQSCLDYGVEIVELDIRKTKDGVPVLMHDKTVNRTTNGSGKVSDLTLAEIKALRLKNKSSKALTNEQVPTLEEAMLLIKGKCMIYLDKCYPKVVKETMAVLKKTDTVDHAMFRATGTAEQVQKTFQSKGIDLDEINIAFKITCSGTDKPTIEHIMSEIDLVRPELLQINFNNDKHPVFDPKNISAIRKRGTRFFINVLPDRLHPDPKPGKDPVHWDWAIDKGINAMQTDRPLWLASYLQGYAYDETPVMNADSVGLDIRLSWMKARGATHHDVYLGADPDAVQNATKTSPEYQGRQSKADYSPKGLKPGQKYYWRIDEVVDGKLAKGRVWNFITAGLTVENNTIR